MKGYFMGNLLLKFLLRGGVYDFHDGWFYQTSDKFLKLKIIYLIEYFNENPVAGPSAGRICLTMKEGFSENSFLGQGP